MHCEPLKVLMIALCLVWPQPLKADSGPLFGLALEGMPQEIFQVEQFEKQTGLNVSLLNLFLQWPKDPATGGFPLRTAQAAARGNIQFCLTWEPMYYSNGEETTILEKDILSGHYDPYITRFAKTLAAWNKPCLIRFAHEMNLARYHWGGAEQTYGPQSPQSFKAIFRYVVKKLREMGARKARFVFCPNSEPIPNDPWNTISAWYPGQEYVDVLGMDGYNWGTTQTIADNGWKSDWRDFKSIFYPAYEALRTIAPEKPLYVFETSCAVKGGDKAHWIAKAMETAKAWRLAGFIWFHADKEVDWRLTTGTSPTDLSPFRTN